MITQTGNAVCAGHIADLSQGYTEFINISTVQVNHGVSPFQTREEDQFPYQPYRSPNHS